MALACKLWHVLATAMGAHALAIPLADRCRSSHARPGLHPVAWPRHVREGSACLGYGRPKGTHVMWRAMVDWGGNSILCLHRVPRSTCTVRCEFVPQIYLP